MGRRGNAGLSLSLSCPGPAAPGRAQPAVARVSIPSFVNRKAWTPAFAGVTNEYGNGRPDPSYGCPGAGEETEPPTQTHPHYEERGDRKGLSDHAQFLSGAGEGRDGAIEVAPVMRGGDLHP